MRSTISALAASVLFALAAGGCSFDIPSGFFACDTDNDCPSSMSCSSGYCVSSAAIADGGTGDGGTGDGGTGDGGTGDGGTGDGGLLGGGCAHAYTSPGDADSQPDWGDIPTGGLITYGGIVSVTTEAPFANPEAVFDGVIAQAAAASASVTLSEGSYQRFLVSKEWNCAMRLTEVTVHAPTDAPFVFINATTSGTGQLHLMGMRENTRTWISLAEKTYDGDSTTISFSSDDLGSAPLVVAVGVAFEAATPPIGTARVAEVELHGYCGQTPQLIEWHTSDFWCASTCEEASNSGEETRRVECRRANEHGADERFCELIGPKPTTFGGPCTLECPGALKYIGYREFTYSNQSGWLHESSPQCPTSYRVGAIPSSVTFGSTRAAIEGSPCSALTPADMPDTYFVGISCVNPDYDVDAGVTDQYCAFRCEPPEAE